MTTLNNEKIYNTSEKSARYTQMEPSPQEKKLYEKCGYIYRNERENGRYMDKDV